MNPSWQTSGEVYEKLVREQIAPLRHESVARIVDLGCGAGGVLELFQHQGLQMIGIDEDLASLTRNRNRDLLRVCGSATHIPLPDASVDLVVCAWVMEHVEQPEMLFKEVRRVMKRNAHWIILTPNRDNYITFANRTIPKVFQNPIVRTLYDRESADTFPVVYRANRQRDIARLSRAVGLEIIEMRIVKDPTYLAFNKASFYMSCLLERFIPKKQGVHLVVVLKHSS